MSKYQLIDRQPITVLESQGEMILFSYDLPSGREIYSMERIIAFFTVNELNWEFYMDIPEADGEKYKADFEHLIDTFRILE